MGDKEPTKPHDQQTNSIFVFRIKIITNTQTSFSAREDVRAWSTMKLQVPCTCIPSVTLGDLAGKMGKARSTSLSQRMKRAQFGRERRNIEQGTDKIILDMDVKFGKDSYDFFLQLSRVMIIIIIDGDWLPATGATVVRFTLSDFPWNGMEGWNRNGRCSVHCRSPSGMSFSWCYYKMATAIFLVSSRCQAANRSLHCQH